MLVASRPQGVTWVTQDLSYEYPDLISRVLQHGAIVPSRIGETKEVLDFRLVLTDPERCVVKRKGMSEDFMNEEITQILAGKYDYDRLYAITPRAADLITAATAYGPRVWPQLEFVAEELEENPTSRRAVVYVGRADDLLHVGDTAATAGEMPCTMTWQFHLRDDILSMSVNMRSWDLVWGLSYDVPSFVAVQMMLAQHLNAKLGMYVHDAGSAHVYEQHYDIELEPNVHAKLDLDWILRDDVYNTQNQARKLMDLEEEY